jgi:hypothetical protein
MPKTVRAIRNTTEQLRKVAVRAIRNCNRTTIMPNFIRLMAVDHYINGNLHNLPIDGAGFNVGYKHTGT